MICIMHKISICHDCNFNFKAKSSLRRHIVSKCRRNLAPGVCSIRDLSKRCEKIEHDTSAMFICHDCNCHFTRKFSLHRHILLKHRNNKTSKVVCSTCNKCYWSIDALKAHEKIHDDPHAMFICNDCNAHFRVKAYLKRHILKNQHRRILVGRFRCGSCNCSFFKKRHIIEHYESHHKVDIKVDYFSFTSVVEFKKWKLDMQKNSITQFILRNSWNSSSHKTQEYQCHRSGLKSNKSNSIKFPRRNGSKKLNSYCPAKICVKIRNIDGTCEMKYVSTHIGHAVEDLNELRYIYLDKTERIEIAPKLNLGVSGRVIRDKELLKKDEKIPGNRHTITDRYDINNVAKSYSLDKEYSFASRDDMLEVDVFVKNNEGSILFYKKQKEINNTSKFTKLEEKDFVLIFMNKWQEQNLRRYGHRVIAFDATRTNQYDFLLHTMLILDVDREGIPVAFLLTNRNDQTVISVFLSCIRDRVGHISPMTIMSDMQNSYYNSWIETMQNVPENRLYCSWHVLNAWKRNLSKINNKQKKSEVSRTTYDLLLELNPVLFERKLKKFLNSQDPDIQAYVKYFEQYYSNNVELWAYCFRQNAGVNTNMAIEAFHRVLKYEIGKGKSMTHLSQTMYIVQKYIQLREEDCKIKNIRGKNFTKLENLRSNHHKARKYLKKQDITSIVTSVDNNSYFVRSFIEEAKIYLVTKISNEKECLIYGNGVSCRLHCDFCQICFHDYLCNCIDASIKSNMCKHIHIVGIFLQSCKLPIGPKPSFDNSVGVPIIAVPAANENVFNQMLSSTSSSEDLENERKKMHDIIENIFETARLNNGKPEYLKFIRQQFLKPAITAMNSYLMLEDEVGKIANDLNNI